MLKQSSNWQQQLADAVSDLSELYELLSLDLTAQQDLNLVMKQFPLRVPHAFISRMETGNPDDPLLKQVLPLNLEMQMMPGYRSDPLNEDKYNPVPGLLHKYYGRVLLTLTGACAINCRYCFRRHYPYTNKVPGLSQWQPALDYIASDNTIGEVILSGGDPLLIKDSALKDFVQKLERISHLKTLRIHTRLPIVIPDRITEGFVNALTETRLNVVIVLHSNHANELDASVEKACEKLRSFVLLNQSVLLKGINDSEKALIDLSKRLFELGVLPYYLHLLDPVSGTAHFDVSEIQGKKLIESIGKELPGYLVPRLVREVAGMEAKMQV